MTGIESSDVAATDGDWRRAVARVRNRWLTGVIVAGLVGAAVVVLAVNRPATYDSSAVVSFAPRRDTGVSSDTTRLVVAKYAVYATAPSTLREVAASLGEDEGALNSGTKATIAVDTTNLRITVSMPTPRRAAKAANAVADQVLQFNASDELFRGSAVAIARASSSPSGLGSGLVLAVGGVLAVLLGLAAAAMHDRLRPRLTHPRDVTAAARLPIIASVPVDRSVRRDPHAALANDRFGAAIRRLRTSLLRDDALAEPRAVAFVGTGRRTGTTTIADSFARSVLAARDVDVLLVDADLRSAELTRRYAVSDEVALPELLAQEADLADVTAYPDLPGLSLVPARAVSAADDLIARGLSAVLRKAQTDHDLVVVDGAEVRSGAAALTVATAVDAVVVVTSAGRPTRELTTAVQALESMDVTLLGVVVTNVRGGHWPTLRPPGNQKPAKGA